MMRAALIAALLLALVSTASAQLSSPPAQVPTPAQEEASMRGYADNDKSCQEWTDGCGTCTRSDTGEPVCPNIGIACQPKTIACLRRAEPPK